jgi:hypothetical protein
LSALRDDILGEWLSCFDEILAEKRVDIHQRPLQAAALFVEHAITEIRGDSKDGYFEKPWFVTIYKQTERWYHNRYPSVLSRPARRSLLGVVTIFGTPFEIRVPTSFVEERNPDGTIWVAMPNSILPNEEPLTWIIDRPQIDDDTERSKTQALVAGVAEKLRSLNINLWTDDFPDDDTGVLARQILPHLEAGARGFLSNTEATASIAIWDLFLATEKAIKFYLRQQGQQPPNTHDLHDLNSRSDVGSGPILQPSELAALPSYRDAIKYRYGELPSPSVQDALQIYLETLNIVVKYTGALKRRFIMNNARFKLKAPPWNNREA